jgi:hypothetical protein
VTGPSATGGISVQRCYIFDYISEKQLHLAHALHVDPLRMNTHIVCWATRFRKSALHWVSACRTPNDAGIDLDAEDDLHRP